MKCHLRPRRSSHGPIMSCSHITAGAAGDDEDDLDIDGLTCSVCYEKLTGGIVSCSNKHLRCSRCCDISARIERERSPRGIHSKCPMCRSDVATEEKQLVQVLRRGYLVPCSKHRSGCTYAASIFDFDMEHLCAGEVVSSAYTYIAAEVGSRRPIFLAGSAAAALSPELRDEVPPYEDVDVFMNHPYILSRDREECKRKYPISTIWRRVPGIPKEVNLVEISKDQAPEDILSGFDINAIAVGLFYDGTRGLWYRTAAFEKFALERRLAFVSSPIRKESVIRFAIKQKRLASILRGSDLTESVVEEIKNFDGSELSARMVNKFETYFGKAHVHNMKSDLFVTVVGNRLRVSAVADTLNFLLRSGAERKS